MKKKIMLLTIAVLCTYALEGQTQKADMKSSGWSGYKNLEALEASNINTPGVWLTFTTPLPFDTSVCPNAGKGQFVLGNGSDNIAKMFALAVQAAAQNLPVSVNWNGKCVAGYPEIVGLEIYVGAR